MPIKMNRSKAPAITISGKYWGEILAVNSCRTRSGNHMAVLELRPHDFDTGRNYRKIDVWIDTEEDRDARVEALLDSLPEECEEDLEQAVGHDVGLEIVINESADRTFINVVDFFEVSDGEEEEEEDEFIPSDSIKSSANRSSRR